MTELMRRPDHTVSVVIPVYNSVQSLRLLTDRLEAVLGSSGRHYEVILVDDGSQDGSASLIRELAGKSRTVRGILLMRNYGQHNALLCGIRQARYDITVTMDDDLQHPPEEIPRLLAGLTDDLDVVYGVPHKMPHSAWRNLASYITKRILQKAMGVKSAGNVSAFRVFRTRLRQAFEIYASPYVSIDVLLSWATTRFGCVSVRHDARLIGPSQYTIRQLLRHALNMATGFTAWPLRVASMTGFFFTVFGLLVLSYVVGRYLIQGGSVPGFPFLASIIAIFSGAQLFALGIIGEYLARIHFRSMQRPTYLVREVVGLRDERVR